MLFTGSRAVLSEYIVNKVEQKDRTVADIQKELFGN